MQKSPKLRILRKKMECTVSTEPGNNLTVSDSKSLIKGQVLFPKVEIGLTHVLESFLQDLNPFEHLHIRLMSQTIDATDPCWPMVSINEDLDAIHLA